MLCLALSRLHNYTHSVCRLLRRKIRHYLALSSFVIIFRNHSTSRWCHASFSITMLQVIDETSWILATQFLTHQFWCHFLLLLLLFCCCPIHNIRKTYCLTNIFSKSSNCVGLLIWWDWWNRFPLFFSATQFRYITKWVSLHVLMIEHVSFTERTVWTGMIIQNPLTPNWQFLPSPIWFCIRMQLLFEQKKNRNFFLFWKE